MNSKRRIFLTLWFYSALSGFMGVGSFYSCKKLWNHQRGKNSRSFWHLKDLPLSPSPTPSLLGDPNQVTYCP